MTPTTKSDETRDGRQKFSSRTPARLALARRLCGMLPPLLAERLRLWLYPMSQASADDLEFTVPSITGSLFAGRSGDFHAYPFGVQGYYEWRNLAVAVALCETGDTILEIGANVGTETVGFRDVVGDSGRVVAIEPFPDNASRLQHLVELNGWQNVEVLRTALSDHTGTVAFVPPPDKQATGVGHIQGSSETPGAPTSQVLCARLDDLTSRLGTVRAVFVDAEGAECAILRGGSSFFRKSQPYLVLEASPTLLRRAGSGIEELRRTLDALGYRCYEISRFGLSSAVASSAARACNWFCVPLNASRVARTVSRTILKCGLMPPLLGPLAVHARRRPYWGQSGRSN